MDTDTYLSIPYKTVGRDWNGADCYGLPYLIYKHELGIELERHDGMSMYTTEAHDLSAYIATQAAQWTEVDAPQAYDIIVLLDGAHPTHVACAIDGERMIHLRTGCNVSIEPIHKGRWANCIQGIYRHEAML